MPLIARAVVRAKVKPGVPVVRALQDGGTFGGTFDGTFDGTFGGTFARYPFNGTRSPIRGATLMEAHHDTVVFRVTLDPRR